VQTPRDDLINKKPTRAQTADAYAKPIQGLTGKQKSAVDDRALVPGQEDSGRVKAAVG